MRSKVFLRKAERHKLVHELRAAGASYKEIAEKVGVKSVTIWKYLKTPEPAVPPRRALSLERQKIAREMKANGATYQQIGDHFGFSAASASELLRAAPEIERKGVCSECGQEVDNLCFHHTDYIQDTYKPVCRSCHMKKFHVESTEAATRAAREWAAKNAKPKPPKIGRMGPEPRLLNGKTAKEMAAEWGVGLHQAQLRIAKILGPRWVRRDKGIPQKQGELL